MLAYNSMTYVSLLEYTYKTNVSLLEYNYENIIENITNYLLTLPLKLEHVDRQCPTWTFKTEIDPGREL